jgi:hypothetical protein
LRNPQIVQALVLAGAVTTHFIENSDLSEADREKTGCTRATKAQANSTFVLSGQTCDWGREAAAWGIAELLAGLPIGRQCE